MSIVVCGCSFSSACVGKHQGKHFTEIVAKSFDLEYITYARDAMSNGGIISQIDTAIDENPNASLFLINATFNPRIEFPAKINSKYRYKDKLYNFFYDPDKIAIVSYNANRSVDKFRDKGIKDFTMFSQSITHMNQIKNFVKYTGLSSMIPRVLSMYTQFLYNAEWETQKQAWMYLGILKKLEHLKIPYIFFTPTDFEDVNLFETFNILNKDSIITSNNKCSPFAYYDQVTPDLAHLTYDSHLKVAKALTSYIKQKKLIKVNPI